MDGRPNLLKASGIALIACVVLALGLSAWPAAAPAQAVPEDVVKAAFLYRFAAYVQWPAQALQSPVFTIAVLDDDEVAADLGRLLPGHSIQDRPAEVRVIHGLRGIGDAQMVLLGPGNPDSHRRLIAALADRPVLVVTDEEQGLDEGSAVNFMLIDRRVRFEISVAAAEHAGLRISSELLAVAAHVRGRLGTETLCAPAAIGERNSPRCTISLATL